MKTITAQSGHTIFVEKVAHSAEHPADANKYTDFYIAKNWDVNGPTFFYLAKGYHDGTSRAPKQVHVWYRNGEMWSSYGETLKSAIDGAQRDGWLHAVRS